MTVFMYKKSLRKLLHCVFIFQLIIKNGSLVTNTNIPKETLDFAFHSVMTAP